MVAAIDIPAHRDLNVTLQWRPAAVTSLASGRIISLLAAMSKRQRFFVELNEEEITMISWKKLVADAETLSSASEGQRAILTKDLPKPRSTLNVAVSSCAVTSETAESKHRGTGPLDEDTDFSCCEQKRNSNATSIMRSSSKVNIELDELQAG